MTAFSLIIHPTAYWLHAHGEGGGADFDLVMERDGEGLPLLRGRHVRGLLRLALERARAWGWSEHDVDVCGLLVGDRGRGAPGCLAVGDAVLSPSLRAGLLADPDLIDGLFVRVPSTAIDRGTGTAKPKHLRTVEAAMPVPLVAKITFEPDTRHDWAQADTDLLRQIELAKEDWLDWLVLALPAFDEIGAKRTRGFGAIKLPEGAA